MKAVIYARYSSNKQRGESIDAQVRACTQYAENKGYEVTNVYKDEGISGKSEATKNRIGFQQLLRDAKRGLFDIVLIHKYDRISREIDVSSSTDKYFDTLGIRLISITQDVGDSPVLKGVYWGMAKDYINNLSSEARKGLGESAYKGLFTGGVPPFGYDIVDKKYVINPLEAEYVLRLFRCVVEETGFSEVLAEMKAMGITGKRGKTIQYSQVYEILRNEKYTGVLAYSLVEEKNRAQRRTKPNAIRKEGALPVIIEKPLFEKVQEIMDGRKQIGKTQNNYLCSGLVYCKCGAKMHVYKSDRKGHTYYKYRCKDRCGMPGVNVSDVDQAATMYLNDLLSDKNQKAIAEALRQYQAGAKNTTAEFKKLIARKIKEKGNQIDALMGNLSQGILSNEVLMDVNARIEALKSEIEVLKNTSPPRDFTVDAITSWLEGVKNAPGDDAIHLLIERIDIVQDGDGTWFDITSTLGTLLTQHGLPSNGAPFDPNGTEKPTTSSDNFEVVGNLGCAGSQPVFPTIMYLNKGLP